jgi:hypothetical protein
MNCKLIIANYLAGYNEEEHPEVSKCLFNQRSERAEKSIYSEMINPDLKTRRKYSH